MKEIDVAMVIGQDDSGRYLGLRQNLSHNDDPRYRKNPLETPGGKPEEDEEFPDDIVATAARELWEETGFRGKYVGPEEYPYQKYRIQHEQIKEDEQGSEEKFQINFYPVPLRIDGKMPEPELSTEHSDHQWMSRSEFESELPEHNVEGLHQVQGFF